MSTNSCRSACVSLCACTIVCTCHDSHSSPCRRSLRYLQVQKSLSETAPVASFRGVLSDYTCILSPPETSDPPCSIMSQFARDCKKHVMSIHVIGLLTMFHCSIPLTRFASYHHTRETLKGVCSCTLLSRSKTLHNSLSKNRGF